MYLYIFEIKSASELRDTKLFSQLSALPQWQSIISELELYVSASKKSKAEKAAVAELILAALCDLKSNGIIGEIPEKFSADSYGKKHFRPAVINFGISHTEGFAAIAFSLDSEVGIDIEAGVTAEKKERIGARFLKKKCLDDIIFASPSAGGKTGNEQLQNAENRLEKVMAKFLKNGTLVPLGLEKYSDEFLAKWTAAEAIMKCDGRGFSAYPELDSLAKGMRVLPCSFSLDGKILHISLAEKNATISERLGKKV